MAVSGSTQIVVISLVFSVLAILAVGMRFRARIKQRAGIRADDYLILPGLLFALGLGIVNTMSALLAGLGDHILLDANGNPEMDDSLTLFLQLEFATQLLSVLSLVFTKLSIIWFYRRIFRGDIFDLVTKALIAIVICWGIAFFFASLFECYPIQQIWLSLYGTPEHDLYCYQYLPMFYATSITNMLIDVLILVTPVPKIWTLRMPMQQKIAVSGIFMLGGFIIGISIARIYFFYQAGAGFDHAYDITYNIAPTLYWTQLEAAIAVLCACLPTMRVLFTDFSAGSLIRSWASRWSLLGSSKNSSRLPSHERKSSAYSGSASETELAGGASSSSRSRQPTPYGQYFTSAYPPTTTTTITAGGPVPVHHTEILSGSAGAGGHVARDVIVDTDIHSYDNHSPERDSEGASGADNYGSEYA
ncbi:uncharacterized protein B0I36DRAFT_368412 [Microdochium trichocladiopsis]|uniref:Rhodopsin domain-containing protein n=1 Tax=Microdochium trichocladiopsis TaxID=1682393 RepID=A0A9P9BHD7_9PEZI|nr:uncharacterized protein B0I36DRAFT_368412 [Microdochium trichocladiopsis]KAH7018389.1 hypothetical protein B0I36DRAFT_368412 [Microdochium trichocladiopsis]